MLSKEEGAAIQTAVSSFGREKDAIDREIKYLKEEFARFLLSDINELMEEYIDSVEK